jgi:sugar lactone lactonase YvrE
MAAGTPPRPGRLILVTPDGSARVVAGTLSFPNGMVLTPDGKTLIVAETIGRRLTAFDVAADGSLAGRRVFADVGADGLMPDGICLDAEGAVWVASVATGGSPCDRRRRHRPNPVPGKWAVIAPGEGAPHLFMCGPNDTRRSGGSRRTD